ncbi:DUF5363 family protein [Vibrio scophthalmi]|uniref:DUF5363 family protein n=1 Tax=Vibrio scophthalmi TaxID=45658 RepID=UPI002FF02EB7
MWKRLKHWLERYDAWCHSMGLTLGQKRSCVPYRSDDARQSDAATSSSSPTSKAQQ